MILRTRRSRSSAATSVSPLPALLVTTVSSRAPCSSSAWVSSTGTPELPKPPMSTVAPSRTPSTAADGEATRLSSTAPPAVPPDERLAPLPGRVRSVGDAARVTVDSRHPGGFDEALHQRLCPLRRAADARPVPAGGAAHRRGRRRRLRVRPAHLARRAARRVVQRRGGAEEHLRLRPPDDHHPGGGVHPRRGAGRAARAGPRGGPAEDPVPGGAGVLLRRRRRLAAQLGPGPGGRRARGAAGGTADARHPLRLPGGRRVRG